MDSRFGDLRGAARRLSWIHAIGPPRASAGGFREAALLDSTSARQLVRRTGLGAAESLGAVRRSDAASILRKQPHVLGPARDSTAGRTSRDHAGRDDPAAAGVRVGSDAR